MKPWLVAVVLALTLSDSSAKKLVRVRMGEHPIGSTIDMLKGLKDEAKQQGDAEEVTYSKFETWCSTSTKTLETAISKGKQKVEQLEQTVVAKKEEAALLGEQLASLEAEITKGQAAEVKANEGRAEEAKLYASSDQELGATIDAIAEAITALEAAKSSAAASLAQNAVARLVHNPSVLEKLPADQQASLLAFAASPEEVMAKGDFDAHQKTYKFKSGDIIELLKQLKAKFEDDRLEGTKGETNSQNSHSLSSAALASSISAAQAARDEKTSLLGETQSALATANSSLISAKGDLEADSAGLADTRKTCTMKASEWSERTEIRAHEQKAMDAAIEILGKIAGVRTEAPKNPVLPPSPLAAEETAGASLVQGPRSSPSAARVMATADDPKAKAINLLRREARKMHSRKFGQFAEELAAHLAGPFDEVNNMIQKMVFRLMAEQKDEDEHKNWCDLEMGKTNASQEEKGSKIKALGLKVEETRASAQLLSDEVTAASEMVSTLTAHIAEATEIREAGKEENKVAVKDAKAAQAGIAKAVAVLEDFYKNSGMLTKEAWELLQQPAELPPTPSTWDASYTGVADPSNQPQGVVTLLKQIASDFAKMEADTLAQEEMDQRAFDEEAKSCEIEKARRSKEADMKGQEQKRLLDKAASMEKSMKGVQGELEAANQYWKDLGPACMEGDSTYEARKASRAEEISALKEAQVILADAFKGGGEETPPANFLAPQRLRITKP